jgi:hypothetical protein
MGTLHETLVVFVVFVIIVVIGVAVGPFTNQWPQGYTEART